jgi:GNAT superfamily N-acetyltransferase
MLRRATSQDVEEIGRLFLRARDRMTYLPVVPDEDRPLLGGIVTRRREVWVAEEDGAIVGFLALSDEWLDHLYVDPARQNHGTGTTLLELAKERRPGGLQLWAFQKNDGARRLYERHGFRVVKLTDGADNMEREPDVLYAWRPSRP